MTSPGPTLLERLERGIGAPFARVDATEISDLVADKWGLQPTAVSRIDTERDDTFIVEVSDTSFLLKVSHPDDDPIDIDLQSEAMAHVLARDPAIPVQQIIETVHGGTSTQSHGRIVRLCTFLPGALLNDVGATTGQLQASGRMLARLTRALHDFEHPAADRYLPWDLQHVDEFDALLPLVDPERQRPLERVLDHLRAETLPALKLTRQQVVHNDFHGGNLIADPGSEKFITGILDFGDTVRSYLAADLAVAMSYADMYAVNDNPDGRATDPWAAASALLIGYSQVIGLTVDELGLIPDLVLGRLAQRMLLASWWGAHAPQNAAYTGRNLEVTWRQFCDLSAARPR
ncbi:phosphotransferase [Homoserinimonas sp. OAct 916]|uniref:phosphotransferase n=1 Tax=Homoserinimonas sp. OAct 916 TaxID=2211450 RepID=UPI000DBE3F93|nr:phosphotransferase [Homoserinimonas sp. OAct 916]